MPKQRVDQWMPVFVVPYGALTLSAAHPTEAKNTRYRGADQLQKGAEASWQRIGTASSLEDGSWLLQLTSQPATLQLVIRPARPGEQEYEEPTILPKPMARGTGSSEGY
jgi:hypothetical protein